MRLLVYRHAVAQGAAGAALGRLALTALRPAGLAGSVRAPGPWVEETVPAPGRALVHAYVRECGGDPAAWGDELPPHLFAKFGFPLALRAIAALPYPVHRTLNAGCAWERHAPLPCGAPLHVRARIETLDADPARVRGAVRIVAGTAATPDALEAEMRVFIPLARPRAGAGRREVEAVPADARLVARQAIGGDAGAVFAALTGDFNPIHWLWPAARLAGFRSCILQGFAMHARVVEAVGAALPEGVRALRAVEARFARPLVLPADVGVYARDGRFWLGIAPEAPAHAIGTYRVEEKP